jgi:hypothetical protein
LLLYILLFSFDLDIVIFSDDFSVFVFFYGVENVDEISIEFSCNFHVFDFLLSLTREIILNL